jgi:hypothetical protein
MAIHGRFRLGVELDILVVVQIFLLSLLLLPVVLVLRA